ncbi:MAG: DinB family protein [Cyclobacteriaceae bacterium]
MMHRTDLINDLKARTEEIVQEAAKFSSLSLEELNHRNTPQSWSILECLEHLNRYGYFYIPEIDKRIELAQDSNNEEFNSGWLGNYFAMSMLPGENGKLNKMKTFKSMNPIHTRLDESVLTRFLDQQKQMLELLGRAGTVDLGKVKTAISISKWIKLKLGDTFRVVIYHNQRHMKQAAKVLATLQPH